MFVVVNQESFTLSFTFEIRCFVLQNPPQHRHMFFPLSRAFTCLSFSLFFFFFCLNFLYNQTTIQNGPVCWKNHPPAYEYQWNDIVFLTHSLEGSLVRRFQDISKPFCCRYLLQSYSSTSRSQDWTTPSTLPHRKIHCSNDFIIWWNSMMRCPISKNLRF